MSIKQRLKDRNPNDQRAQITDPIQRWFGGDHHPEGFAEHISNVFLR